MKDELGQPNPDDLSGAEKDQLTGQRGAHEAVLVGRIALPLLAALPWNLDPPRHGAVGAGQPHIHGAERHAAHGAVQTGALVLTAALESLSALVHGASEHTGGAVAGCEGGEARKGQDWGFSQGTLARGQGFAGGGSPVQTPIRRLMRAPKSQ